jgi:hypothetical protein
LLTRAARFNSRNSIVCPASTLLRLAFTMRSVAQTGAPGA